jgi:hypothetical protein
LAPLVLYLKNGSSSSSSSSSVGNGLKEEPFNHEVATAFSSVIKALFSELEHGQQQKLSTTAATTETSTASSSSGTTTMVTQTKASKLEEKATIGVISAIIGEVFANCLDAPVAVTSTDKEDTDKGKVLRQPTLNKGLSPVLRQVIYIYIYIYTYSHVYVSLLTKHAFLT